MWWEKPIKENEHLIGSGLEWKSVPIKECAEPLVSRSMSWVTCGMGPGEVRHINAYGYRIGDLATRTGQVAEGSSSILRSSVHSMLNAVQCRLDREKELDYLQVAVLDGWRSLKIQRLLFDKYLEYLMRENSDLSREELYLKAQKMVSAPPPDHELQTSPPHHATGGAVDVVLIPRGFQRLSTLNLYIQSNYGSAFDQMFNNPEQSALTFYEDGSDMKAMSCRRLLFNAMIAEGFTAYAPEWWHFQMGNQMDALIKGESHARYGYIPFKQ